MDMNHSASMWPRPFERGKGPPERRPALQQLASMWPRPFERGKSDTYARFRGRRSSFNVAAPIRARKVLLGSKGRLPHTTASMWPRPFERGKAHPTRSLRQPAHASMWPRPFERGKYSPRPFSVSSPARLQCGRAHSSAESQLPVNVCGPSNLLQCGRAHSSAES